jgi:hypothetical protein
LERIGDKEDAFKILLGKAKGKNRSENLSIEGRDGEVTVNVSDSRMSFSGCNT